MRLAVVVVAGVLLLTGCTNDDQPAPSPTTSSATALPTPDEVEVSSADRAVRTAIRRQDTTALDTALRRAGRLAGRQVAAEDPAQGRYGDLLRAHRVAGWWASTYSKQTEFAKLYTAGAVRPFAELGKDSALLSLLRRLEDRVGDDWRRATGKELNFLDTYGSAFDAELPKP